jgi:hypothetical protein
MKQLLTIIFGIGYIPMIYSQTISTINSGAISDNNLIYSVGDVFVIPLNQNDASSGMIGAISRIEFMSLGINELVLTNELKFYPNPTSSSVFLELRNEIVNQIYIFDLYGKLIENKNNVNSQIDLSNLQTGTYIIKTDNQNIKPFKIIKR